MINLAFDWWIIPLAFTFIVFMLAKVLAYHSEGSFGVVPLLYAALATILSLLSWIISLVIIIQD